MTYAAAFRYVLFSLPDERRSFVRSYYCYWLRSLQVTLAMVRAGVSRPSFATINRSITIKDTLGWSAVVFHVREIRWLFTVVFCVVKVVHELHFGLVINETCNKLRWVCVLKTSCSDTDAFWQKIYIYIYTFQCHHMSSQTSWSPPTPTPPGCGWSVTDF